MDRKSAIELIENFLAASMSGDKEKSRALVSPELVFTFTGGRRFERAEQTGEFNAKRYAGVKKDITGYDVCAEENGRLVVYCLGTLYGSWPDGTPFEGNRFIDRFEIRDGRIEKIDVWNDSAEWLLTRAGLAEDQDQAA
jgi:ketosteroid isomerase-like protein